MTSLLDPLMKLLLVLLTTSSSDSDDVTVGPLMTLFENFESREIRTLKHPCFEDSLDGHLEGHPEGQTSSPQTTFTIIDCHNLIDINQ